MADVKVVAPLPEATKVNLCLNAEPMDAIFLYLHHCNVHCDKHGTLIDKPI